MPHWGIEYNLCPTVNVFRLAKKMVSLGVDIVLGSHTHCVQPVVLLKKNPVVFSMGNFMFPDRLICPPRSTFYPDTTIDISTLPQTDRYPYVKEVTLKRWKEMARHGMLVIADFTSQQTKITKCYTYLDQNNYLDCRDLDTTTSKKLSDLKRIVESGFFVEYNMINKVGVRLRLLLMKLAHNKWSIN